MIVEIAATAAYVFAGMWHAIMSNQVWKEDDNTSWTSYLLFPQSHVNGTVGASRSEAPMAGAQNNEDARFFYYLAKFALWPLPYLFWNLWATGIYLPSKIRKDRERQAKLKPVRPVVRAAALPPADGPSLVARLEALCAQQKSTQEQIDTIKNEIKGALEIAKDADPNFPDLVKTHVNNDAP